MKRKYGPTPGPETKTFSVVLPPDLGEWAKSQPEGLSGLCRRLLHAEGVRQMDVLRSAFLPNYKRNPDFNLTAAVYSQMVETEPSLDDLVVTIAEELGLPLNERQLNQLAKDFETTDDRFIADHQQEILHQAGWRQVSEGDDWTHPDLVEPFAPREAAYRIALRRRTETGSIQVRSISGVLYHSRPAVSGN